MAMTTKSALSIVLLALSVTITTSFSIKEPTNALENVGRFALSTILGSCMLFNSHICPSILSGGVASAAESRVIGEIAGSGLVFKVSIGSTDLRNFLPASDHPSVFTDDNIKRIPLRLNLSMIPKSRV